MAETAAANGEVLNRNNNLSAMDNGAETNGATAAPGKGFNMKRDGSDTEMEPQLKPDKAGDYVRELLQEKQSLDSSQWPNAIRLLDQEVTKEVARVQAQGKPLPRESKYVDIYREKSIRVAVKVLVPIKEHPKFNFVGKLLGPKGNSMKRLQEDTMTKMAVLGRGSMKDKQKEEELRMSMDPKYAHLSDDLHVEIAAFAPPAEAHARIAYALAEVRKYLIPDSNDEIRQEQMREMELIATVGGEAGDGAPVPARKGAAAVRGGARALRPPPPPPPPLRAGAGRGLLAPPPPPPRPPLRKPPPQALLPRPTPTKTKVLSILDRARAAMEETSYACDDDAAAGFYDPSGYDAYNAAGYGYDDYDDAAGDYYNSAEAYPDEAGGRWKGFKAAVAAGGERARYRPVPYARPAK